MTFFLTEDEEPAKALVLLLVVVGAKVANKDAGKATVFRPSFSGASVVVRRTYSIKKGPRMKFLSYFDSYRSVVVKYSSRVPCRQGVHASEIDTARTLNSNDVFCIVFCFLSLSHRGSSLKRCCFEWPFA